jgi:hypothetical protein
LRGCSWRLFNPKMAAEACLTASVLGRPRRTHMLGWAWTPDTSADLRGQLATEAAHLRRIAGRLAAIQQVVELRERQQDAADAGSDEGEGRSAASGATVAGECP